MLREYITMLVELQRNTSCVILNKAFAELQIIIKA